MSPVLTAALGAALNVALVLVAAPLCQGLSRKVTARLQSRRGPPLRQPLFDLLKLLGKEDLESGESPVLQRFAALLSLASVLAVACLVPMGRAAPLGGAGDVLLLLYLLTLSGTSTLLAGAAAGSTYSLIGVSREMMSMVALEPILAVALVTGAVRARSLRLEEALHGAVFATGAPLSGLLVLAVTLLALQALVGRAPFDVAEAETELMEGPLVEYSGRKLALFKYAQMARLVVHAGIVVALFAPWGRGLPFLLGLALFWAQVLALVLLVTVVAATHARFRVDQAMRWYARLLAVALAAVALASYGY